MDVLEILKKIGYTYTDDGEYVRMSPLYRQSDNATSLQVHKVEGNFKDWGTDDSGSFALLVKKTLNVSFAEAYKIIEGDSPSIESEPSERVESFKSSVIETFSMKSVGTLLPHHKVYLDKKISLETIELFKGGVSMGGFMRNRYTFPIFDDRGNIIGFSGRALMDRMKPKWKNKGKTRNWVYPIFLNKEEIQRTKSVRLVESIGDMLALWEVGIRNVLVLFGVKISKALIAELISLNPETIYVSLNNEPDNNNIGNNAAEKITEKLSCIFDKVSVELPLHGDFSDMLVSGEMEEWIKIYGRFS